MLMHYLLKIKIPAAANFNGIFAWKTTEFT